MATESLGQKVGIVLTRRSPLGGTRHDFNAAIVSKVLPDSIFHPEVHAGARNLHLERGGDGTIGLKGAVVVAVNGTRVRDARHGAMLVACLVDSVALTVKVDPMEVEEDEGNGGDDHTNGVESHGVATLSQ